MPSPSPPPAQTAPWHDTAHHDGRGFRTPWRAETDVVPPLRAARWLSTFPFRRSPDPQPTPFQRLDGRALQIPPENGLRITWLGHATLLFQMGGLTVLTDPVFSDRASPLTFAGPKREAPLPLPLEALPRIDVVLLSHNHYDHLDPDALARLDQRDRPLVLTPLGLARHLPAPYHRELDWGQFVEHGGFRFHCTPAKHFSGRTLWDRDRTLWASWYLEPLEDTDAPRVYWAGDSGYSPHFHLIREWLGAPEVVLLPIGAYRPRWFMRRVHVDPEEAVQAYLDLGGVETGAPFVPYHWGTFDLAEEPLDEPPRLLREHAEAAGITERLRILPVGGVLEV